MVILVMIFLIVSAVYIQQTYQYEITDARKKSILLATALEAGLPKSAVVNLNAMAEDVNSSAYQEIKRGLVDFIHQQNDVRFAYLFRQQQDDLVLMVDSELPDSADYSPPGQVYSEASAGMRLPYQTGENTLVGPVSDRWGTWMTVLVPVRDPATEQIIAILGVDYPAETWDDHAVAHTAQAALVVFVSCLFILAFFHLLDRNKTMKAEQQKLTEVGEKLSESERSKAILLSHLPGMAYRCKHDLDWTMLYVSPGCALLTGYEPDDLIDNKILSYNDLIIPEYRGMLWDEWKKILDRKVPFRHEYQIMTKSGEMRWVLELGQGVFDGTGAVEALEGIIIDISRQKELEEQSRQMADHDYLTGLHNRLYFETQKQILDSQAKSLPLSVIIADINGVRLINDAFGYSEGDTIICETAKIIRECCRDKDILARTGGDEFSILMPRTGSDEAYSVLQAIQAACHRHNSTAQNHLFDISLSIGFGTKTTTDEGMTQTIKTAEEYMCNRKLLSRKSSHNALLTSIMTTMFERSQETEEHAERIAVLTRRIGMRLDLSQKQLDELVLLSMLHDIGKIAIDDRILNKPGKLDEAEWAVMKKHPEIGYRIAMTSPDLESIADFILSHHERWDGKGYPQGLQGTQIPLMSRILAVADAFDAMTQNRVYRSALSQTQALAEIMINAGTQFDPDIVRIFVDSQTQSDTGAEAASQVLHSIVRP